MPLRLTIRTLNDLCRRAVYKNLVAVMEEPSFGDRFLEHEETDKDKLVIDYFRAIPNQILRTFINPLIEHVSRIEDASNIHNNLFTFLLVGQPEHLTMPVHGEHFGDVFHFVFTHGKHLESMKFMTSDDAPPPSNIIKSILHSMEFLLTFEMECEKPFVEYCPYLFSKVEECPMMPQLTDLRLLNVARDLSDDAYDMFYESIVKFLKDHPAMTRFTFECPHSIVKDLKENDVILNECTKVELPLMDVDDEALHNMLRVFPNAQKLKIKAKQNSCHLLSKFLKLTRLDLIGHMDEFNPLPPPDDSDDSDDDYNDDGYRNYAAVHLENIRRRTSNFSVVLKPFTDGVGTSALTSLHLTNYHDIDLKVIGTSCPQLECFRLHCCTFADAPILASTDAVSFARLRKLRFSTSDSALELRNDQLYNIHGRQLTFAFSPSSAHIMYLLRNSVHLEVLHLSPCMALGDACLQTILQTNKFEKLEDLYLGLPSLTIGSLETLLSTDYDNLRDVVIESALCISHLERRTLIQAVKGFRLNVNLRFDAMNPFFQYLMNIGQAARSE